MFAVDVEQNREKDTVFTIIIILNFTAESRKWPTSRGDRQTETAAD